MQASDSTAGTFQKRYFDLHTQGVGSRVRHPKPEFRGFSGMNRQQINQLGFSSEILCSDTKFSMTP